LSKSQRDERLGAQGARVEWGETKRRPAGSGTVLKCHWFNYPVHFSLFLSWDRPAEDIFVLGMALPARKAMVSSPDLHEWGVGGHCRVGGTPDIPCSSPL
jgi:hypothetical protein